MSLHCCHALRHVRNSGIVTLRGECILVDAMWARKLGKINERRSQRALTIRCEHFPQEVHELGVQISPPHMNLACFFVECDTCS